MDNLQVALRAARQETGRFYVPRISIPADQLRPGHVVLGNKDPWVVLKVENVGGTSTLRVEGLSLVDGSPRSESLDGYRIPGPGPNSGPLVRVAVLHLD